MAVEPDIKRINYFDGLFLKEAEFLAEQLYHLHMRRRINYMLFEDSGVVQIETGDMRVTPTTAKRFLVTPGMAISHREEIKEGREVILTADSGEIDLTDHNFVDDDTVIVAIHYEKGLSEPQTGVDPAIETRANELAVVSVHNAVDSFPDSAPPLDDDEQYIRLGHIEYTTMTVLDSPAERQTAPVRSALFGGGGGSLAPTITGIDPNSGAPGEDILLAIITGTNLAGVTTTVVTAPTSHIEDIHVNSATETEIELDFDVVEGAPPGTPLITVTTSHGSASIPFTVTAAATVVVESFTPTSGIPGDPVTVVGTNIRNPGNADDTVIHLVDATDTTQVRATIRNVQFLPDSGGRQQVLFSAPAAVDVTPPPGSPSVQQFRILVEFGGGEGLSPPVAGNLRIQY